MEVLIALASYEATAAMKRGPLGARSQIEANLANAQEKARIADAMHVRWNELAEEESNRSERAYFTQRQRGSAADRDKARKQVADCKDALARWDSNQEQMRTWLQALGCDGHTALAEFALATFASHSRFPTCAELKQAQLYPVVAHGLIAKRVDRYVGARYQRFWKALGKPDEADPRVAYHMRRWRAFATHYYSHHGPACESEPAWADLAEALQVFGTPEENERFWHSVSE